MAEGAPSQTVGDDGELEVESEEDVITVQTDGHMLRCVEPRRTTRRECWGTTGKSLQAPVVQHHRYVQNRDASTLTNTYG